jgi:hypothetical protein
VSAASDARKTPLERGKSMKEKAPGETKAAE